MNHHVRVLAVLFVLLALVGVISESKTEAAPQAVHDVKITVSTKLCEWAINRISYVIHAQNTNTGKDLIATFNYDSVPPGRSLFILNSQIQADSDRFPKLLEVPIAAGATVPVGCKYMYSNQAVPVEVVVTLASAMYANPGMKLPPLDARMFTGFVSGFHSSCPNGKLLAIANLHPFLWLSTDVQMSDGLTQHQEVGPYGLKRIGCDNQADAPYPVKVTRTELMERRVAEAPNGSTTVLNPFARNVGPLRH
jgi:hypothetical protein